MGALVEDLPVVELDLNPVFFRPVAESCIVLDARIRLASPTRPARQVPGSTPGADAPLPGLMPVPARDGRLVGG